MPDFPSFDQWFPPVAPPVRDDPPAYGLRHPRQEELTSLDAHLEDWCEARAHAGSGRTWVRHFASTCWIAETADGARTLGLLLGFRSVDRPNEAVVHALAVDPAFRRRGIGRALVERLVADLAGAGVTTVSAACRPDDPIAVAFFVGIGFVPQAGPGSTRLHGVPAFVDWDGPGQDRALLARAIGG